MKKSSKASAAKKGQSSVGKLADGVVVGSALVGLIEKHHGNQLLTKVSSLAGALARAVHSA